MNRHVAINAVGTPLRSQLRLGTALTGLMAGEAPTGVRRGFAFGSVDVVTCGASHFRRGLIAPASLQKSHLIAMDIDASVWIGRANLDVICQSLAWNKGEGRLDALACTRMTLRANLYLPVVLQSNRSCGTGGQRGGSRFSGTKLHVIFRGAMAAGARNSQGKVYRVEMAPGFRHCGFSEVRCVTFQAAWRDGSFEIGGAIDVSRAVDPAIQ